MATTVQDAGGQHHARDRSAVDARVGIEAVAEQTNAVGDGADAALAGVDQRKPQVGGVETKPRQTRARRGLAPSPHRRRQGARTDPHSRRRRNDSRQR